MKKYKNLQKILKIQSVVNLILEDPITSIKNFLEDQS